MKGTCTESHDSLRCDLKAGHTEPHRDPVTGQKWRHPKTPYGMRSPKRPIMGHARTKPGVTWSDKPVVGYKVADISPAAPTKKGAVA